MIKMLDEINIALSFNNSFDNKIVVVGPSMGGQISRYALKYMEDNSWNHNTRLWISFDSPHHGANIPYGFQEMLRYLSKSVGVEAATKTYQEQLRSPAARQMLIHQADPGGPTNIPWSLWALQNGEPLRQTWKNTLNTIGFPNNLRKIALLNGSYNGGQYHTSGNDIFQLEGRTEKTGVLLTTVNPKFINTSMSQIMRFWQVLKSPYTVSTFSTLPYGAIDACPGGTYDIQQEFYEQTHGRITNEPWPVGFMRTTVTNMTHNISFIPTVSGLALYNPNFDWGNSLDVGDILCNNQTPFDNIFVPANNESHTSISARSAKWLKDEIFTGQNPCTKICNPYLIGDQALVVNGTETYYLYNVPSLPVYWSVSSGLQILSSTQTSVTVKKVSSGIDFVNVHIDNSCGGDAYVKKLVYTASSKPGRTTDIASDDILEASNSMLPNVQIFPNPTNDIWNVAFEGYENVRTFKVYLCDITGRQIKSFPVAKSTNIIQIDSHELSGGVYILKVDAGNEIKTFKLMK